MGSPTTVAVDGPAGEDGRTGVIGTTDGSAVVSGAVSGARAGSGVSSKLSMTVSSVPEPETVLRKTRGGNL
jgi:hypothetical protein